MPGVDAFGVVDRALPPGVPGLSSCNNKFVTLMDSLRTSRNLHLLFWDLVSNEMSWSRNETVAGRWRYWVCLTRLSRRFCRRSGRCCHDRGIPSDRHWRAVMVNPAKKVVSQKCLPRSELKAFLNYSWKLNFHFRFGRKITTHRWWKWNNDDKEQKSAPKHKNMKKWTKWVKSNEPTPVPPLNTPWSVALLLVHLYCACFVVRKFFLGSS